MIQDKNTKQTQQINKLLKKLARKKKYIYSNMMRRSFVYNITTLIAHNIGSGALLYNNLSDCFDCTLRWNGCSFVSESTVES